METPKRTRKEIIALMQRLDGTQWLRAQENAPDDTTYMNLHDIQCVLQIWNAATKLRAALVYETMGKEMPSSQALLIDTEWLIPDGFQAGDGYWQIADSPEGENGEESET